MNMKSNHRLLLCCFVAWFFEVVECHRHLLDAHGNVLKEENLADERRNENGVIKGTNIHEYLLVKSNLGLIFKDKADEDAIKISDDVCKTAFPNCTATGGNCILKVEEGEKSAVQCECPDKSVYKASEGCTVSDEVCKSDFPKCMDTGGKCNVEVGNEEEESVVHCQCPEMKGYKEGVGCRACNCGIKATGCSFVGDFKTCTCLPNTAQKGAKCFNCDCGTGSTGCKFSKSGQKVCKCKEKFSQNEDTCEECDCGVGSTACTFNNYYTRSCTCMQNFKQKGHKCEECDCGNHSFSCQFVNDEKKCDCYSTHGQKDGVCTECQCGEKGYGCNFKKDEKICDCYNGYAQKYGVCTECGCGDNSYGCEFENGVKKCKCRNLYGQKDGECVYCDCGYNARRCSIDGDIKICDCYWNYAQKEGQCVACLCGTTGFASCHFDNGEKKCECKEGFTDINGICKDFAEECEETCGHAEHVTCERKGNLTLCMCHERKQFDYKIKKCRTDNCYEKCGVNYEEVHDEIQCKGDPFGEVDCVCRDDRKMFDPDMRKCRGLTDKCEEICGLDKDVTCDHKGNNTLCLCDEGKQFDLEIKKCRKQKETQTGLSASAIAAIVVGIIVGIVLLAVALYYYLKYYKK